MSELKNQPSIEFLGQGGDKMSVLSEKFRNFAAGTTMLLAAALPFNANAHHGDHLHPPPPPQHIAAPQAIAQQESYEPTSIGKAASYARQSGGFGFGILMGQDSRDAGFSLDEATQYAKTLIAEGMQGDTHPYAVYSQPGKNERTGVSVYRGEHYVGHFGLQGLSEGKHIEAARNLPQDPKWDRIRVGTASNSLQLLR